MVIYRRRLSTVPMRVLVRNADAGRRNEWVGPTNARPLSRVGWSQAEDLAARLENLPILRALSSPSLRCRQTIAPLARRLSLRVQSCPLLERDSDAGALVALLQEPATENAVLCADRETLIAVFAELGAGSVDGAEPLQPVANGAAWTLRHCADGQLRVWPLATQETTV